MEGDDEAQAVGSSLRDQIRPLARVGRRPDYWGSAPPHSNPNQSGDFRQRIEWNEKPDCGTMVANAPTPHSNQRVP